MQDIKQYLDSAVMFTAAQLDSVLRSLLDKHAPMNNCKVSDKKFGCPLNSFTPISENSLRKIILQCAPKICELDAIPTTLLFECLDAILPTSTNAVNLCLLNGEFSLIFKKTTVHPLLK